MPLASATLSFSFVDLDLIGGSDPTGFTETLKVYGAGGSALAPTITMLGQSGLTPFAFNVSGNSTSQTITFTFSDVRSLVLGDPFYVKLVFGANMTADGKWQNTMEMMTATLTTTTVTPEPSSLLLFGSRLYGMALREAKAGVESGLESTDQPANPFTGERFCGQRQAVR